jgi:PmbA protein
MDDLLALAQRACEAAVAAGAEFADASAGRGRHLGVELEKGAIKSCDARWSAGVSVRAFVRGGQGWASSTGLDEAEALAAARTAVELARVAEPDPDFASLPEPAPHAAVDGLDDPRVAELEVGDLIRWAGANIDAARQVEPDVVVAGGVASGWGESALVNSRGVHAASRGTHLGLSIFAIVRRADDVGSFYEFDSARRLADFEPDGIGARATEEARRFLGARTVATGVLPVVFGPLAAHAIFGGLCASANAESVQRRRSYLVGRKGERVASELLTLVDDALIPAGLGSSAYDGEGVPRRPLTVVDRGVLRSWLHNSYTAHKAGEPNTGHSTRGGISPTNVNPALGDRPAEAILRDTAEGLYLPMGGISPNPASGDFSGNVDFGFKIERGQIAHPVRNTMIAGNVLELLGSLDAISSDARREPGMVMPTIRVQGLRVAGGE